MRITITLFFIATLTFKGFSQEAPLKEFAEDRSNYKFCLYPSTLRMLNISQNPDYNEMVNDIQKLLIYQLDSATAAGNEFKEVMRGYEDRNFEEYASMSGGGQTLIILGNDSREEMIGVFGQDGDNLLMFFLKGTIGFQKIPTLMEGFKENDMINIFEIGSFTNNNRRNNNQEDYVEREIRD